MRKILRKKKRKKKNPKETEISYLHEKVFKEMVIGMLTELDSGIEKLKENFNQELESV